MFEKIVLRRATGGEPVSAGQLAEALLYYQNVHIVIDHGSFHLLVKQIGIQNLLGLLRRPNVSAVYCEESVATHTESIGAFQIHSYIAFSITGHEKVGGHLETRQQRFEYFLQELGYERKQASRFARTFLERVPIRRLTGDHYLKGGVTHAGKADLSDAVYVQAAIRCALSAIPGGTNELGILKFDVVDTEIGFHIFTNIDFAEINRRRSRLLPPEEPLTVALLLNYMLEARTDIALASFYGGDFATSSITSEIIQVRHSEFMRRYEIHDQAIGQFTEIVLPDSPSLKEVIDAKEKTFDDFLLLLDKADRFKHWLQSVNPDEGLVRTYLKDVSSDAWIDRLPAKTLRYVMTSAIDKANPVAGFIAGIADSFLVDKLLGGWRPNHFVNSRIRKFVSPES